MLHDTIAKQIPQLARGQVWCRQCGRTQRTDSAEAMSYGWPKCCGYTMTIDSPEEQKRLAAAVPTQKSERGREMNDSKDHKAAAEPPLDCRVMPATCGKCTNAIFERTPTGRIKKGVHGRCGKQKELLEYFSHTRAAPCIVLSPPHAVAVWPDYDATNCPMGHNIELRGATDD